MTNSKSFITYAHESDIHKAWVRRLAEDLTSGGVEVILDQWHLDIGDDLAVFMENSIDQASDIVLICTPEYGKKASARVGGVGYEQEVLIGDLITRATGDKTFIPVLRSGNPSQSLPRFLRARLFADFRDDTSYSESKEQLLRRLLKAPKFKPPPKGTPAFAIDDPSTPATGNSPSLWVLVAGTGVEKHLTTKIRDSSRVLGKLLAERGYGLVTGGWPGVDEIVAREFANTLDHSRHALEDVLTQIVVESELPAYPAGNLVLVPEGHREWTEGVERADAIVLIGGMGGTKTTGEIGFDRGKLVLPVADTDGDAKEFYIHMLKNWQKCESCGIERRAFSVLGRDAPGVMENVVQLLDTFDKIRVGQTDDNKHRDN